MHEMFMSSDFESEHKPVGKRRYESKSKVRRHSDTYKPLRGSRRREEAELYDPDPLLEDEDFEDEDFDDADLDDEYDLDDFDDDDDDLDYEDDDD